VVSCAKGGWVGAADGGFRGSFLGAAVLARDRRRAAKELYCSAGISGQRSEVADQGVVLADVYMPLESGAQADDLGGLDVEDENTVLDPVAVGLQGTRDPAPPVVADDVVSDEESAHVAGAHLVTMPL
jgi:hypothetical protein